jgi:hypothetical protein
LADPCASSPREKADVDVVVGSVVLVGYAAVAAALVVVAVVALVDAMWLALGLAAVVAAVVAVRVGAAGEEHREPRCLLRHCAVVVACLP